MIPQQRVGRTHCVFIELIHLLPSPLSPTREVLGVLTATLTSPTTSHAPSKSDNILGFRLRSRHAHKQQRKLASLAGKPAQQLMASWRRALKAIHQTEGKARALLSTFTGSRRGGGRLTGKVCFQTSWSSACYSHHDFCVLALCPSLAQPPHHPWWGSFAPSQDIA